MDETKQKSKFTLREKKTCLKCMMNCTFVDFLFVFFFSLDFNFDDFLCQTRDVLSVFVLFYCFSTVSPLGLNLSLSFECKCKQ